MFQEVNKMKILNVFLDRPETTSYIRQLSELSGCSPPTVSRIVEDLDGEGLLVRKKGKLIDEVSPDFDGQFLPTKRAFNLAELHECGLVSLLKKEFNEPEAIILFGSYSRGEDRSTSDIDIAIVSRRKASPDVSKFEKALNRHITIHIVDLKKCKHEFLNTLANGVVLSGYLKVLI